MCNKDASHNEKSDDQTIISKRQRDRQEKAWERYLAPIVSCQFNGRLSYQHFEMTSQINSGDLGSMFGKLLYLCYDDNPENPEFFSYDGFHSEIHALLQFLAAGFDFVDGVEIRQKFFRFLSGLFINETLPIFLELLCYMEMSGGWCPQDSLLLPNTEPTQVHGYTTQEIRREYEAFIDTIKPDIYLFYEAFTNEIKSKMPETNDKFQQCALDVYDEVKDQLQYLDKTRHFSDIFANHVEESKQYRIRRKPAQAMVRDLRPRLGAFVKNFEKIPV